MELYEAAVESLMIKTNCWRKHNAACVTIIKKYKNIPHKTQQSSLSFLIFFPFQAGCHRDAIWKHKEAAETWFSHSAKLALKPRHLLTASYSRHLINVALGALPKDEEKMHFVLFEHWDQGIGVYKIQQGKKTDVHPNTSQNSNRVDPAWRRERGTTASPEQTLETFTHLAMKRTTEHHSLPMHPSTVSWLLKWHGITQGWWAASDSWKSKALGMCFCLSWKQELIRSISPSSLTTLTHHRLPTSSLTMA